MRYTFWGDRLTRPALHGLQCDPVYRESGDGAALVVDAHGKRYVVPRRRLRVNR